MLEHQLEVSEQQKQSLDERLREVEEEKRQLQRDAQSKELELASHLEELRAKVGISSHLPINLTEFSQLELYIHVIILCVAAWVGARKRPVATLH